VVVVEDEGGVIALAFNATGDGVSAFLGVQEEDWTAGGGAGALAPCTAPPRWCSPCDVVLACGLRPDGIVAVGSSTATLDLPPLPPPFCWR